MIGTFASSVFGDGPFLNTMLQLQLLFYTVAIASYKQLPGTETTTLNMVVLFLQLNLAAFVATGRFF